MPYASGPVKWVIKLKDQTYNCTVTAALTYSHLLTDFRASPTQHFLHLSYQIPPGLHYYMFSVLTRSASGKQAASQVAYLCMYV